MPELIELSDGRSVGYAECGDPRGVPLVYLHGAPGSRLEAGPESLFAAELGAAGVRLIGMERAGYGISAARAGRQMYEQAADVEGFADRLGIERFAVVGWSAGGPVALATAARLGDRVSAVGAIASLAPIDKGGLDGVGERAFLEQAIRDPAVLRREMKELAAAMRNDPATTSLSLLGPILCDADVEFTLRPEVNPFMMANLVESARGDYEGYTDDCVAQVTDWGFDLAELSTPVRLAHGTDDRIVPTGHSRYLAKALPNASLTDYEGDGHISVLAHLIDLSRQLIAA
jgi:pimeloyl-ACP methyl ester carboxylesterase